MTPVIDRTIPKLPSVQKESEKLWWKSKWPSPFLGANGHEAHGHGCRR